MPGPPHRQTDLSRIIGPLLTTDPSRLELLGRLHAATGVRTRHLVLPPQDYADLGDFGRANDLFLSRGSTLAAEACRAALAAAAVPAQDVGFLLFTSVTGVAAPSLDVRLVTSLGLRPEVRRMPSFGLGCAGGVAGIARLRDFLLGNPDRVGLLVSLELCSLTLQHGDDSTANLISSGLFGDGAAAVVMAGADYEGSVHGGAARAAAATIADPAAGTAADAGPDRASAATGDAAPDPEAVPVADTVEATRAHDLDVIASASHLYPGTENQLGWHVGANGFAIMLAAGLPTLIEEHLAQDLDAFLTAQGLDRSQLSTWVVHAGGPRILEAVSTALDLPPEALRASWESLAEAGNLSSASALHILAATLDHDEPPPGGYAILLAFGPGVGAEFVLLRRQASPAAPA